jgi:NADP-dependent 3-hydroxy acid dehydrogenase YdfG
MLKGKTILISGASRGIGKSLAFKLAKSGGKLCLVARNMSKSDELIKYLKENNSEYYLFDADLSKKEEIEKAYKYFKSETGSIDILINNAGRGVFSPITEENPEQIKEILDLNIFGLIYLTRLCVNDIIKNEGTILNVSSVAGRKGFQGLSVYCASKWAVVGFTESLRDELCSKNVKVMCIEPGLVDTDWGENLPDSFIQYKNSVDMLTPDNIADIIVFVLNTPQNVCLNEILVRPTNQPR